MPEQPPRCTFATYSADAAALARTAMRAALEGHALSGTAFDAKGPLIEAVEEALQAGAHLEAGRYLRVASPAAAAHVEALALEGMTAAYRLALGLAASAAPTP